MPYFVSMSGSKAVSSLVAGSREIAEKLTGLSCVEHPGVPSGWIFDEESQKFWEPGVPEPADTPEENLDPDED